jgi:hypothetical protein
VYLQHKLFKMSPKIKAESVGRSTWSHVGGGNGAAHGVFAK